MFALKNVFVPITLGAMLVMSIATTGATAAVRFDPGLATVPSAEATVEKVWWHRHWHRHYGYHWHWHWRRW